MKSFKILIAALMVLFSMIGCATASKTKLYTQEEVDAMLYKEQIKLERFKLQEYANNHENPEVFEANYDYYTPLLNEKDPWTIEQIGGYPSPEKWIIADKLYAAMANGSLTLKDWIARPKSLKEEYLKSLSSKLEYLSLLKSIQECKKNKRANPEPPIEDPAP
jgi:hypothetical protein